MGGLVISPLPALFPSTCIRRRRSTQSPTAATTTATASNSDPQSRPMSTPAPAGDAQYVNMHQTALVVASSVLTVLALVLSALLPADRPSAVIKMGLRVVPVYTLSLHFRTSALPTLIRRYRYRYQYPNTPPSCLTPRGRIDRAPLSVAWLATAALTVVVWLYTGCTAPAGTLEGASAVYVGLVACALLECGLVSLWGEGLFVASLPRVSMKVENAVIESERKLEEGTAKDGNTLACAGRN